MFTATVERMGRLGNCSFSSVTCSAASGVLSTALGILARYRLAMSMKACSCLMLPACTTCLDDPPG